MAGNARPTQYPAACCVAGSAADMFLGYYAKL